MKQTRIIMGMPVAIEIVDEVSPQLFNKVFDYFTEVDNRFSTYKKTSEVSAINRGEIELDSYSREMKEVMYLANKTKFETDGLFDIKMDGKIDPSGIVKGWAILNASNILKEEGFKNFYIDAGGDIQVAGFNSERNLWKVGIRNPFNVKEIIKVLNVSNLGIATSGIYERGKHIYNPKTLSFATDIAGLTVIGEDVLEADRIATGAFVMGKNAIDFLEAREDTEGYLIDKNGIATFTSGFEKYLA